MRLRMPRRTRAVERVSEEPAADPEPTTRGRSRTKLFLQGAAVFVVMFLALRWVLTRGDDSSAD